MADRPRIPLTPRLITPDQPDFAALAGWPFPSEPFYVAQIPRLVRQDLPARHQSGRCLVWVYHDPDGAVVGFGSLDISDEYSRYTQQRPHPYIPALAVHPAHERKGHGLSIVEHLVDVAAVYCPAGAGFADVIFLDVYTANEPAIRLYQGKCGFDPLNPNHPLTDPAEGGAAYFVMARRIGCPPLSRLV